MSIGMGAGAGAGAGGSAFRGARARPKYRKSVKAAKVSKSVKAYVRAALTRDEEEKIQPGVGLVAQYVSPDIGPLSSSGSIIPLISKMFQGVTQGERVGSEIRPKSFSVKGIINLSGKVNQAWNLRVRMMVVQDKSNLDLTQQADFTNAVSSALLMSTAGSGVTVGYDGSLVNHFLPINTDRYKVWYDAEFPLSSPVGQTSQQSPLIAGAMASMPPNSSKSFDINVKLPAVLKYDDGATATGYPLGSAPYLIVGWCNPDEPNVYSSNGPQPCYITAVSKMIYSDA